MARACTGRRRSHAGPRAPPQTRRRSAYPQPRARTASRPTWERSPVSVLAPETLAKILVEIAIILEGVVLVGASCQLRSGVLEFCLCTFCDGVLFDRGVQLRELLILRQQL